MCLCRQVSRRESRLRTLEEIHSNPTAATASARHAQRRRHNDSDVSSDQHDDDDDAAAADAPSSSLDEQLRRYNDQIPLLDSLQRELASAQDTINALTNQNSELRAQMLRHHHDTSAAAAPASGSGGDDTGEVRTVRHSSQFLRVN